MTESSSKGASKNQFLSEFLRLHVPPGLRVNGIDEETLAFGQRSLILDNTINKSKGKNINKSLGKRKRKTLSASQRKELKLFDIKPEDQRYELYIPMHELWTSYMKEVTNIERITEKGWEELMRRIAKCDLHGAIIKVTKCKCPSLIGVSGIVLMETKNSFKVICSDDRLKVLPKMNAVFSLELCGHLVTIYGNNFRFKASERSARSFKAKSSIDL